MNNWFKRNSTHFLVGILFIAICLVYFNPVFSGKTLGQNDVTRAQSTQTEINAYKAKGTTILWTNQIHGGMPAFQIWAPYTDNITTWVVKLINYVLPNPIGTVLILLLGTYLLFCVLRLDPWLAATGAIAFTFSSYNLILVAAGHANQLFAIAFFAPVLAGVLLLFRKRYIPGMALTAFFLAMEIKANHIQMTYYLLLAILILVGIELYHAVKNKLSGDFFKAMAYASFAILIAVAVNASTLWSTYEYAKETIRGHSNLTQDPKEPTNGLARDYAYEWSQGVEECITFIIPDAYGGSTRGSINKDSNVIKALTGMGASADQAAYISESKAPLYWGEKPFTEGSFYFGAVICFLFVFGLFIVKTRMKWWLVGVIVLTLLLSFGKNWPYVSDLFFDYFPLYNKFRAVESILAVAGLCFPILALLALKEIVVNPDKIELLNKAKFAFYITGGITLIIAVTPGLLLSFRSENHPAFINQLTQTLKIDLPTANLIGSALIADRTSAAQSDAIRSFFFITLSFLLVWAFIKNKINIQILSFGFLFLVLIDLWGVDKRYLNNESFTAKQDNLPPQPRDVDLLILRDKDPDYKVLDLTKSITSDASTPYFHKSIGGYSAVRLKRFDELIESQFSKTINVPVLSMLNTKYIITSDEKTQALAVQQNPEACGHAWLVNKVKYVDNADQEMDALTAFSPKDLVIVDQKYKSLIHQQQDTGKVNGKIELISYSPDQLIYQSNTQVANIAVFSEIYYKNGWKMLIDGNEKPYFRANYLLRAAEIPAGKHQIEFIFHPVSYYAGEKISLAGSILLVLVLGGAVYTEKRKS
ncbi:YfhO family protein [Pedobacter sp. L105]|uniref:YfhO family protein n=1 Tax=Pedobacter sp. L105 TaxID=1641871 RepID=UPI00131D4EAE|nr:YfhO family protein [Pedobacter sp. L105]